MVIAALYKKLTLERFCEISYSNKQPFTGLSKEHPLHIVQYGAAGQRLVETGYAAHERCIRTHDGVPMHNVVNQQKIVDQACYDRDTAT
ncbi:hypothetical protein N7468_008248 [Penicillium chermesinum]|uniref:Uncharacterized protein n=1 Tax=Penicillium chermesinum TaxID=63820 RepID=A0A9W9NPQ2_9EURO|nr:uncharacterized protein N7468_008248 [Penicillium chermesinum]KAJ5223706.1 hypothetical protein N7468_008248 [Penicillium chermesinum]KAJ6155468.1 hypothetical protein N7470_006034 [Penicillium chermesinum]